MALGLPSRDQVFMQDDGLPLVRYYPTPGASVEQQSFYPEPDYQASVGAIGVANRYIRLNPEIAKSYVINPTNQGQRAGIAARASMMFQPRNSPSRSQISEGYTIPIQDFTANNVWETPSGQHTAGEVQSQPSIKRVSPFTTSSPIQTRMPWDV